MFSIYLIIPVALGRGVYSASNRNEYRNIFLGGKERPTRKVDSLTATCSPVA
jgi:hypothetical protein